MKTEYVLPEMDREKIEKYQKQIEEIRQSYIEDYLKNPFQSPDLETRFGRDSRVQTLEKAIVSVYTLSVGKYIVTVENEEDKERLRGVLESKKPGDG